MIKTKVRCWKDSAHCKNGEIVEIYFTVSDFYEGENLFICPHCGALFAINPEEEFYTKRKFVAEKNKISCPECNAGLADALPYPESFPCKSTGQLNHYERIANRIPPDQESILVELWNPLS